MNSSALKSKPPAAKKHKSEEERQRSNRERGLAYRVRQRDHEASLSQAIARLREELDALVRTRFLLLQTSVVSRNSAHGSLATFMRNHYRVLRHGFPDLFKARSLYTRQSEQEIYISQALDPDIAVGNGMGATAYMAQWRQFQRSFANINNEPRSITVVGPDHDPTVVVGSLLTARITENTFQCFFAYLGYKTDLMHKLVGREIVLPVTARFNFTPDGRIRKMESELDFVSAFANAGASVADLARLFQNSVLTLGYGNVMETPPAEAAVVMATSAVINTPRAIGSKRSRTREYEQTLVAQIDALKRQIGLLVRKQSLLEQQTLITRGTSAGSLMKLVQYYLTLVKFGITSNSEAARSNTQLSAEWSIQQARNQRFKAFLHQMLAPNATTGGLTGAEQLFAAWRALTLALEDFWIEILALSIAGPDQDPIVSAKAQYHAVVCRDTFRVLFPSVPLDSPLVTRFLGVRVTIPVGCSFQFTPDGRILRTTVDFGLVEAFVNAGASIREVAHMMEHTVITAESTFDPAALHV